MLEERIQVMAVTEDAVLLAARRDSACGGCAVRSGCGHGLLDGIGRTRTVALTVPRDHVPAHVSAGQSLLLGVPDGSVLAASIRVYLLPLLGLLGGVLAAHGLMPGHDGAAVMAAASGLAVAFLAARHFRLDGLRPERIRCRTLPAGERRAGMDAAAEPESRSTV